MKTKKTKDIIIPNKIKKNELMNMVLHVPFQFNTGDKIEAITEKLDKVFTDQRNKTLEAIAKILGLKINWEEN